MHFSTAMTILSGLALATTSVAYDTISFTTWNCTDCNPVPGQFCSVNRRDNLPIKDQCITLWNGSTFIKTYDPTLPSCQGKKIRSFVDGREDSPCMQSTSTPNSTAVVFRRCTSTTAVDARARSLPTLTKSPARPGVVCNFLRAVVTNREEVA
jgi:hypothetical protein